MVREVIVADCDETGSMCTSIYLDAELRGKLWKPMKGMHAGGKWFVWCLMFDFFRFEGSCAGRNRDVLGR